MLCGPKEPAGCFKLDNPPPPPHPPTHTHLEIEIDMKWTRLCESELCLVADLAAGLNPGGGCHSRAHSVVSAAVLPSKAQADGEGINAAEVSAALHHMGSSQGLHEA